MAGAEVAYRRFRVNDGTVTRWTRAPHPPAPPNRASTAPPTWKADVSRHRSPRGRGARQGSPLAAPGRSAVGRGAHRSAHPPSPTRPTTGVLQRTVAAVAVTGGAVALVAAAAPAIEGVNIPLPRLAADDLPAQALSLGTPAAATTAAPTPAPVVAPAAAVDTAAMVRDVQQEASRRVAQIAAAEKKKADEARKAASGGCAGLPTGGLGAVLAHVRTAAQFLGCQFGKPTMYGVSGRGGPSDHPSGKAVDFMVDRATGDALASCALENKAALGITYVIWRQRINYGSGWQAMEDRGSPTANHYDHVHVSFANGAGGTPAAC